MAADDPSTRNLVARIAAAERWAREPDRVAATVAARDGRWRRYLDRVDPDRVLSEAERVRRAESLRRADLLRLSLRSAEARRLRARAEQIDTETAAELVDLTRPIDHVTPSAVQRTASLRADQAA